MILFYQESFFYPQDFQICVLPSSTLFSILDFTEYIGHYWFYRRRLFMISSKVYGMIMSLNWI